jgi:hypothetical protein
MKRVLPSSDGPIALSPDVKQSAFTHMPTDMTLLVLGFLDSWSVLSFGQTCRSLHPTSLEDHLWQRIFVRDFQGATLLEPGKQPALEEYKRQVRVILNFIQGNFGSQFFPLKQLERIDDLTVAPDGRLIISGMGGTVKILNDAKTDQWKTLGEARFFGSRLFSEGKTCVSLDLEGGMKAWNIDTCKEIKIPQGKDGFVEPRADDLVAFVNGRLLKYTQNIRTVQVWNPELKDDPVLSFTFDRQVSCMAFYNETLFVGLQVNVINQSHSVELCNIVTNARKQHHFKQAPGHIYVENDTRYFVSQGDHSLACVELGDKFVARTNNSGNKSFPTANFSNEFLACIGLFDDEPIPASDVSNPGEDHRHAELTFLPYPGVNNENEFKGCWDHTHKKCSWRELSLMLQGFATDIFSRWNWRPTLTAQSCFGTIITPTRQCILNQGRLYFSCWEKGPTKNPVIFYADFTASDQDILKELAQMLRSTNTDTVCTAMRRFEKLPKPLQEEINKMEAKVAALPAFKQAGKHKILMAAIMAYLRLSQ